MRRTGLPGGEPDALPFKIDLAVLVDFASFAVALVLGLPLAGKPAGFAAATATRAATGFETGVFEAVGLVLPDLATDLVDGLAGLVDFLPIRAGTGSGADLLAADAVCFLFDKSGREIAGLDGPAFECFGDDALGDDFATGLFAPFAGTYAGWSRRLDSPIGSRNGRWARRPEPSDAPITECELVVK